MNILPEVIFIRYVINKKKYIEGITGNFDILKIGDTILIDYSIENPKHIRLHKKKVKYQYLRKLLFRFKNYLLNFYNK